MDEPNPKLHNPSGGDAKGDEIVVFIVKRPTACDECKAELDSGSYLRVENDSALCMSCADLDRLEFLPRGDAALTRRATRHSGIKAVVVEWSRRRKRYERQGILATPAAIAQAQEDCLADKDLRQARAARNAIQIARLDKVHLAQFASRVSEQFPGCPLDQAQLIALHACEKYSGRVGRSAAAKELEPDAIRLAVIAHVRHVYTGYDAMMDRGHNRREARALIRPEIDRILAQWEQGLPGPVKPVDPAPKSPASRA